MVKRKFKYESGAATQFISRRRARKALQISLADFRRLCILKGIYPHEPKNKKQVNKGSTAPRTFYFKKDIDFLQHEPLIAKFRKHKATIKKLKRARGRKDYDKAEKIRDTMEQYTVDHIVLERYPNFIDAVRDLDDALTLIFTFASFPQSRKVHTDMIRLCKRLKYEFLNYVIQTQSLRKAFISIKGIYLQAEIQNETITWFVQHTHAYSPPVDVDFRVLQTFADFYTHLVGFTLSKLYSKENLVYPPQVVKSEQDLESGATIMALLEKLNSDLVKNKEIDGNLEDQENLEGNAEADLSEKQQEILENEKRIKNLFKNCVFQLGRETPKEILALLIRSSGGKIVEDVDDTSITHQIVDRGANTEIKYPTQRSYLQPQWVFDSLNAKFLLPVERFLPGSELPAHLSPFEDEKSYKPPERMEIEAMARGEDPGLIYGKTVELKKSADTEAEEIPADEESDFDSEEGEEDSEGEEEEEQAREKPQEPEPEPKSTSKKPKKQPLQATVKQGSKDAPKGKFKEQDDAEELRLAKSAMSKKFKRLDKRIEFAKKRDKKEAENLQRKRKIADEPKVGTRKSPRKAAPRK